MLPSAYFPFQMMMPNEVVQSPLTAFKKSLTSDFISKPLWEIMITTMILHMRSLGNKI